MQLNEYPLNVTDTTIKDTLQSHNSEHKSKELEPLKIFISYENGVAEKLKRVASKYGFTTVFTKTKGLAGQIQTKQKDKMETSGKVYEADCSNCLKMCTGETGRKVKERMKEHKDDEGKSRKDTKITGVSQHIKTTAWDDVRIICRENNWKRESSKKQLE